MAAETWHGTQDGYRNHRCRCRWCVECVAVSNRLRYAARRAKGLCVNCGRRRIATHAWSSLKVRLRKKHPHAVCAECLRTMALVNAQRPELGIKDEGWRSTSRLEDNMPPDRDDLAYLERLAGEPLFRTGARHGEVRSAGPPHSRMAYVRARTPDRLLRRSLAVCCDYLPLAEQAWRELGWFAQSST